MGNLKLSTQRVEAGTSVLPLDRHWYDGTSHALRRKLQAGKSFPAGSLRSVGKLECRRSSLQSLHFAQGTNFRRPFPGQSAFGVEQAVFTRDHGGQEMALFPDIALLVMNLLSWDWDDSDVLVGWC